MATGPTDMQKKFAVEYSTNGENAKAAAIATGYSEKYASELAVTVLRSREQTSRVRHHRVTDARRNHEAKVVCEEPQYFLLRKRYRNTLQIGWIKDLLDCDMKAAIDSLLCDSAPAVSSIVLCKNEAAPIIDACAKVCVGNSDPAGHNLAIKELTETQAWFGFDKRLKTHGDKNFHLQFSGFGDS